MPTFHFEAEVKDDRRILITLPPEAPLGKVQVRVSITPSDAAPRKGRSSLAEWAEQPADVCGMFLHALHL